MLTSRTFGVAAFFALFFFDDFALLPDFFDLLLELDAFLLFFFAGMFPRLRELGCDDG